MRVFEHVLLRVISLPSDSMTSLHEVFSRLLPLNWEKEKLSLGEETFETAEGETRTILTLHVTKQRHIRELLSHLVLPKKELLAEVESRVDEDCQFFVRFDLDSLLEGKWELTSSGRCLHCTFSVSAHPARRDRALSTVTNYLNGEL